MLLNPHESRTLSVLDGGEVAFAEIVRRIGEAQHSVEMRTFLWRDDKTGHRMAEAVLAAADRGVRVSIKKDRIAAVYEYSGGSRQSFFHGRMKPKERFEAWFLGSVYGRRSAGRRLPRFSVSKPPPRVRGLHPLAQRLIRHPNVRLSSAKRRFDHSKLFVIDDRVAVLGSMGIGDNHHDDWVDMMIEVEGAEHVARLRQRLAGVAEFDPTRRVDFLLHSRDGAGKPHQATSCALARQRLDLIDAARQSILVEMAYFGDRRFELALTRAIRRGVDVTLVTGERADVLGDLNLASCNALLRLARGASNFRVALHPRNVHAKVVVVDDRFCDIGSANFTPISHGVYDEIDLYADDPGFARHVRRAIERHVAESRIATERIPYRKVFNAVERAIVAYQGRAGS